jgi:hypothetical protein
VNSYLHLSAEASPGAIGTFKIPPGYTEYSSKLVFSSADPVPG